MILFILVFFCRQSEKTYQIHILAIHYYIPQIMTNKITHFIDQNNWQKSLDTASLCQPIKIYARTQSF